MVTKPLSRNEMRARAVTFAARWKDETSERGQSQSFWTEFLDIYGVDRKRVAAFEQLAKRTSTGNYGFIDLYWPGVLIAEQKSAGKDLAEAEKQALDYLTDIKQSDFPGLVITSDFARIRILDLEKKDPKPVEIKTADLGKEYERFLFIAGYAKQTFEQEIEANVEASELMGQLYDAAEAAGYKDHEANVLLTRLLFLMFGDDTAMWARGLFYSFVHDRTSDDASDLGAQLAMLFQVLNTPEAERPKNLDQTLVDFPYVNGGLFSENLRIAAFTPDMRHALIKAMRFGWAAISPAVFGSLFQSVKSKELRRELGEHYTPEKTIMKVIAPLFLDDLKERLAGAKGSPQKLRNLRKELATYNFLDPACGCGNFLIIAYREMRRLELEILKQLRDLKEENQLSLDPTLGLQVTVSQFAGIEIEEWPAKVAETAMFLVDHQMNLELAQEFGQTPDRLPIKEVLVVRVGNALKQAWSEVAPVGQNTVVLGNPPFLGRAQRSAEQSDDMKLIWGSARGAGDLDYVACWFHKAADYVSGSSARVGFVSTNSLTQGEQPAVLWGYLLSKSMKIDFAHRTFNWTNEARGKAAVHVVVIGFSQGTTKALKPLWTYVDVDGSGTREDVEAINAYLLPGPMVTVGSRTDPLVPEMPIATYGSMPIENGHLVVTADEAAHLKNNDADAFGVLRRYVGAQELLHGEERYCLWLEGVDPSVIRASKFIMDRVTKSKEFREASNRPATRALASTPGLFGERRQPLAEYIAIPKVSSERRRYIPMSILDPSVISSGSLILVRGPNIRLAFGVLSSRAMTLWNSVVSGRMTSRFQFSVEVTYNNFPWPSISKPQEDEIVRTVDEVLSVRAKYGGTILADLYDPTSMPPDLASAHASLDKAVLATYGLKPAATEAEVLATLFARYEVLAAPLAAGMTAKPKRRAKKT